MQIIIFTGLQASGKSTYYRRNFIDTHVRLNLDLLRGSRSKEKHLMNGCIAGKIQCCIDNTNVTAEHRSKYIELFKPIGYEITSIYFNATLDQCLARNKSRTDKDPIPPVALHKGNKALEIPERSEGFDKLMHVSILEDGTYKVVDIL